MRAGLWKKNKLSGILSFAVAGMLIVAALSGCGGEFAGRPEGDVVSGSAVSGNAVSGKAVSGGAVSDPVVSGSAVSKKEKKAEEYDDSAYTYCNDRYVYYADAFELAAWNRDTGEKTAVEIKDIEQVCYADNDWVYYVTATEEHDDVWRMPVKKDGKWGVDEQGKELLLEEEEGFDEPERALCDGRYIVYITAETYKYREYDIEKKAWETNEYLEKWDDYAGGITLCGGSVFLTGPEELLRKKLGSDEVETVINEEPGSMAEGEGELFILSAEKDKRILQYSLQTEKIKTFIDRSEIKKVLKEEGLLSCPLRKEHVFREYGMFVSGSRLYVQIAIENSVDENDTECRNIAVLSKGTEDSGELVYEKELTRCLQNPEERQKPVTKFMPGSGVAYYEEEVVFRNRGLLVMVNGDQFFMYVEQTPSDGREKETKNRWACYDLTKGEFRYLTKEDSGWYMRYCDRRNHIFQGWLSDDPVDLYPYGYQAILYMMPNNYDF